MFDITYPQMSAINWSELKEILNADFHLPYSVHIPLQYPESKSVVLCDCALNVYPLAAPSLDYRKPSDKAIRDAQHTSMVSFAFGKVPYTPQWHRTLIRRKIDGLPIFEMKYYTPEAQFTFEYCLSPDEIQHIRITALNNTATESTPHLWMHLANIRYRELFYWHYTPFHWDASFWLPDTTYTYAENLFYDQQGPFAELRPNQWDAEWVPEADFSQAPSTDSPKRTQIYNVQPQYRIQHLTNTLHLSQKLQPNEEATIEFSFRFGEKKLQRETYATAEKQTVSFWKKATHNLPSIHLSLQRENNILEALRLCSLQLLMDCGVSNQLRPCQGGNNEIYHVWVWEAMCSLRPMIWLGHFKEVKKVIEFIFALQDGGYPPDGDFTTLKGAIGTTAVRWACTTGSALLLASEYLLLAHDKKFEKTFLPKMLYAAQWIISQIRATRIPGNITYGIFPFCRANDCDSGQMCFTDAWTMAGLMRFRDALRSLNHPAAKEINDECNLYKKAMDEILAKHAQPDGYIPSAFGDTSQVGFAFRKSVNALCLCDSGVYSATNPLMRHLLDWIIEHFWEGPFTARTSEGAYYIGNHELGAFRMFLQLHQWKQAWAAAYTMRRFTITPDAWVTQERFCPFDPNYTPWQPNASNNGRILEMQIDRFYFESEDELILFGGFAPDELNEKLSLNGLYTRFGQITVTYQNGKAHLQTEKELPKGLHITTPWKEITLKKTTTEMDI